MTSLSISDLRAQADELTPELAPGEPLQPLEAALIGLATCVSVTSLDRGEIDVAIDRAFDSGASLAQIQEIIALSSGLGVHSLMASSVRILESAGQRGLIDPLSPLDPERQVLWDRYVGTDPFWEGFSHELPGFLEAMLRLSPDIFAGFFEYCAIPWRSGTVRAKVKELAAMACDAAPSHRFLPGFRIHLGNAIKLGVGRTAIMQALDIAENAPQHRGTP